MTEMNSKMGKCENPEKNLSQKCEEIEKAVANLPEINGKIEYRTDANDKQTAEEGTSKKTTARKTNGRKKA